MQYYQLLLMCMIQGSFPITLLLSDDLFVQAPPLQGTDGAQAEAKESGTFIKY